MRIYIIRHGETDLNAKGVMQGWIDEPLNQSGKELAAITGRCMKGIHFDYCISSPSLRAMETVEIVLRESGNSNVSIDKESRIKEINFGLIDGHKLTDMGPKGLLFFKDPFRFEGFPEGENIQDVCKRTQEFFEELINRDDDKIYLIGTHGCAMRAMLNHVYENSDDFWHFHVPYNCAVNILDSAQGKTKLIADDKIYYDKKYIVERYNNDLL